MSPLGLDGFDHLTSTEILVGFASIISMHSGGLRPSGNDSVVRQVSS